LHAENAFPERTDIFCQFALQYPKSRTRLLRNYLAIGCLKAGVTPGEARAELDGSLPTIQFNPPIDWRIRY
jgi:hypothetical protein